MMGVVVWVFSSRAPCASINEIRISQLGVDNDEYFEIGGASGESLASLTYLVLGDDIETGVNSGIIETVISLSGQSIPADGFFLGADATFGGAGTQFEGIVPDLTTSFVFEELDNKTHVLVDGFFGNKFDDLDTNDDGILDVMPWSSVVDAVGIVEQPDTSIPGTDQYYGATLGGLDVGPSGIFLPNHVYRLPDMTGGFVIGQVLPNDDDTPGSSNSGDPPAGGCDLNGDMICDCADVDSLVTEIVAGTNNMDFDLTSDGVVDTDDLDAWREDAGETLTASGNPIQEGDANLDGSVDGQDFILWNDHKFTSTAEWCSGDFNADGAVDGQDFILWNDEKFTSADHLAVPEPNAGIWIMLSYVGMAFFARRR